MELKEYAQLVFARLEDARKKNDQDECIRLLRLLRDTVDEKVTELEQIQQSRQT